MTNETFYRLHSDGGPDRLPHNETVGALGRRKNSRESRGIEN